MAASYGEGIRSCQQRTAHVAALAASALLLMGAPSQELRYVRFGASNDSFKGHGGRDPVTRP